MSNSYELFSYEEDELIIKDEGLNFLKSIKEEIILITVISSLDDKNQLAPIKISLLSNLTHSEYEENLNTNLIKIHSSNLEKENYKSKILLLEMNCSDKHLFSLLFIASSLFVFCVEKNIDDTELNKFKLINNLQNTIELKNKKNKETFLSESAPKLIIFLANNDTSLPKNYLENQLNDQSGNDKDINSLKENIIKFFPDRECMLDDIKDNNKTLINKILSEINPKIIRGKYCDGNSLAFFLKNFCEIKKNSGNPNFDTLFNNLINNDLETFKNKALNYFNTEMSKLDQIENEESLIPKIYQIKIDSIEMFTHVNALILDLISMPEYSEYKTKYNNIKAELEKKFTTQENLKLLKNIQKSELACNELLNKYYEKINQKIINRKYNGNNTDEFMKDYEEFLNSYKNEAKGNNKLKCLINFLEINKPKYFKYLVYGVTETFESKEGQLNEHNEEYMQKIEDVHDQLERKKREIKNLNAEIERIEEDIKKVQSIEEDTIEPIHKKGSKQ
jgi:hypothetical protein